MAVAICTGCGLRVEGTPDEYQAAVPGHPFGGRCPRRRGLPSFERLVSSLQVDDYMTDSGRGR